MSVMIHVNGPAQIWWLGTGLGYSSDGVNISFDAKFHDVITDRCGWMTPENTVIMGEEALVSFELIVYDKSVLDWATNRDASDSNTLPNANIGQLMMRAKNDFNQQAALSSRTGLLTIKRTTQCINESDMGYNFYESYLSNTFTKKLSTRATKLNMTFRCLPLMVDYTPQGAQSPILAGTLFNRS